jgi:hypothetical protein
VAGQDVEFLMFDVGLGLKSLTPRTLSPDSGRCADAERKGVQGAILDVEFLMLDWLFAGTEG